jgi:C-terminal processing protease CtpA/Prc
MRKKTTLLAALLGALGSVAAMAQTNVYSVHSATFAERHNLPTNGQILLTDSPPISMPEFKEVYQLLSTNLEGVSAAELNRAAVQGMIHQLEPRVSLAGARANPSNSASLAEARVFDNSFAYFRIATVTSNLPEAFLAAYNQLSETNKTKLRGLVLDLRFADGFDYAAAAKLADCFLSSDHPLLDWQTGSAHATLKADAITLPVAVLVNARTSGAAEALAAVLRETDVGLILGGQTAGQASVFKEFPLSNGGKLRVAVAPVSFGAGKALPHGVMPDIAINTSLEDERAYLQEPYKVLHSSPVAKADTAAKEAQDQPRLNEVELIREHRNGNDPDEPAARIMTDKPEPAPVVADPALARALDLLKGLAVVQPNRPG